jgi:DeoR/GlpR family transcriptional regulator of sugar metabolism
MMAAAERVVFLMDSSKLGVRSLSPVAAPERIGTLITDARAPGEMLDALRARGVQVHVAG